ncbi:MAG: enoyl-CoA hydratase/isomerase family protein [Bacteroidota bacterium]
MDKYFLIKTRVEDKLFYLTLARAEKRNAFTPSMLAEIFHALTIAKNNPNVWLIIIEAEGQVFCAGMDMKVFKNPDLDKVNAQISPTTMSLGEVIRSINKPIIAKVEGPVLAGGILIIAESTFVVAHENATFSLPEVKRGLFPFQVMNALSRIMSERKIIEMCILAKTYSAEEAKDLGLVTHFYQKTEFENGFQQLIDKVLEGAPLAIAKGIEASKKMKSIQESERYQYLQKELKLLRNTHDAHEGINAFVEKRKPKWENS